jgi:hypothetical protein
MRLYDRLNGGEKAALVQSWNRFAEYSKVLQQMEQREETKPSEATIGRFKTQAVVHERYATLRAAYLSLIDEAWFRLTFKDQASYVEPALPKEMFEQGQSIDDVLWEMHPGNLFDEIAIETGLQEEA